MSAAPVLPFPAPEDEYDRLASELPTPEELAQDQDEKAREALYEDRSAYPRFLVPSLDNMVGPFAPGEVVVVTAREGQGKSLFCLNLFDDMIRQDVTTLYIGTEQSPHILKQKHACLALGISARKLLKPMQSEIMSGEHAEIQAAVDKQLEWFLQPEIRRTAIYANTPHIDRATMAKWIGGGHRKYGLRVAIVDHIDHVNHGSGANPVHELTQTIRLALTLATDLNITVILASQVKRAPETLLRYQPPQATDLAGSSDKERTAALILGLWRPLRDDVPMEEARKMAQQAKEGRAQEDTIYKPMTMGVKVLKDRLGDAPGRHIQLHVGKGGRLEMDSAATHGIRTHGGVL